MSCLLHSRYNMTAEFGAQTVTQSALNAIVRVWSYNDSFECIARGIQGGGIRVVGSMERWTQEYDDVEWIKLQTDVFITKRNRVKDIKDFKGNIIWPGEYDVVGVIPVLDPFGQLVEYDILLRKAQVQ